MYKITIPIANIINTSRQTGIYPNTLNSILINPIQKNNSPSDENHFRPICCVNVLAKIISIISNAQLTAYVVSNNIINKYQSEFARLHSCTTAVLDSSEEIYSSLHKNLCIFVVLIDFSDAFP